MTRSTAKQTLTAIICGPTACGKTEVAHRVTDRLGGAAEIISADSMQVYRGLDIGTAKPNPEEQRRYHYHLIDIREVDEQYSAADFRRDALKAIELVRRRGRLPLVVGGTGLYIRALVDGVFESPGRDEQLRSRLHAIEADSPGTLYEILQRSDPAAAAKIHPRDIKRIVRALEVLQLTGHPISKQQRQWKRDTLPPGIVMIGLDMPRELLYRRIERRVDTMMASGLLDELRGLLERGYRDPLLQLGAIGYKELIGVLEGEYGLEEGVELLKRHTRRVAKRQLTWFRNEPRILWVRTLPEELERTVDEIMKILERAGMRRAPAP